MKKSLLLLLILLLVGCSNEKSDRIQVAVSIVPQETFLKAITGDLVDVIVMIPPGSSPSNYEPSPKHMAAFDQSSLYFTVDVAAEENILGSIKNDMKVIDLADAVDEKYPARYFDEDHEEEADDDHEGRDPHMWLSPKRAILMIEIMRDEMISLNPENKLVYMENADNYINQINNLDSDIKRMLSDTKTRKFLIYHPSYGYFADEYQLEMIAIEKDGKDATMRGMEVIIELALKEGIKLVMYQEEFDSQQAEIIAKEINGETIKVAPLSSEYLEELKAIVTILKDTLN